MGFAHLNDVAVGKAHPTFTYSVIASLLLVRSVVAAEPSILRAPDAGLCADAAADSRGRIHLLYFKGDPINGDAFYVRSDDGKDFGKPVRVNSQPGSVVVAGSVRGPHLAIGKDDRIHVAWNGSGRAMPKVDGKAPMLYARLLDDGTFEPQRSLITSRPGIDGGGSIAADKAGNVYVAWHAPGDTDGETGRRVWLAKSNDDGQTFAAESAIGPATGGACGCCGLSIAAARPGSPKSGDDGRVAVWYRCADQAVNRDGRLLVSTDAGKSFNLVKADPWRSNVCVMSTAAVVFNGSMLISVWETAGRIRLGRYDFATAKMSPVETIDGGSASRKHPTVAVDAEGNSLIAWTETAGWGKGGSVGWQAYDAAGRPTGTGRFDDLKPWGAVAVLAGPDGKFTIAY